MPNTYEIAVKIHEMLERDGKEWMLDRGSPCWARIKIARPCDCDGCGASIPVDEFADLFCLDFNFRKVCLVILCLNCAKTLKRKNALGVALLEVHRNGYRPDRIESR